MAPIPNTTASNVSLNQSASKEPKLSTYIRERTMPYGLRNCQHKGISITVEWKCETILFQTG